MYIPSVTEAVDLIVKYYKSNKFEELKSVKSYLESDKTARYIAGDADRFHNATVSLTRIGFFDYAYALAEVGHKRYPRNTDLLGDLICYGLQCRDLSELEKWYTALQKINKRFWTWRAYQFSFDYWMERLPLAENEDQLADWDQIIESIYTDFKNNFKFLKDKSDCEKAFIMEYEYLSSQGEEEAAIKALQDATVHELTKNKCPQCALMLADYYFGKGNYADAYKYADLATKIKEDQPSINLGYTNYIRAMSKEAVEREGNGIQNNIEAIYNAYFSAYIHLKGEYNRQRLIDSVEKQVKMLERETGVASGIEFSKSPDNIASLLQSLGHLDDSDE